MLQRLIDLALRQRLLVGLALLALALAATVVIPRLNLDAFPDVTNIQVSVDTEAPGLAAEEVEQLITFPIEAMMYALPNVAEVRSISKTGLSGVTVVFKDGTDLYFARQLVFEQLQSAREQIPAGIGIPELGPNTSGLGQVYQYVLRATPGSGHDLASLRSLNDWVVKPLLMPVEGVTDVLSFGGEVRQYQVRLQPDRLLSYDITQAEVAAALERNNLNVGGWYLNRGQEQLVIRGVGAYAPGEAGLEQLRQTPVRSIGGTVITVGQLAEVAFGAEIRQGAVTMTARDDSGAPQAEGEVVSGVVLKRMGANTRATILGLQRQLPLIQQTLPDGVSLEPFYDQADLVQHAVRTVTDALLIAFVLITVILALFLMNLRATLLVLLSIPVSIGIALMVMAQAGLSANLMSLGGIAVAIGMLVDGSVVMVENIFRHLAQADTRRSLLDRVRLACQEVARPVLFATLIILVVFLPLFGFEGVEARMFQPMAISIILAMLAALVVALLVVPAMAVYLFPHGLPTPRANPMVAWLERHYGLILSWALHRRRAVVAGALALVVLAALLLPRLGTEFVPELEEGTLNLRVTLAPSSSLDTALSVAPKLEALLMAFPEVTYTLSRIGRPEIGGDPEPVNNIEIYIGLKPVSEWTSADNRLALQGQMTEALEQHPGLLLTFSQPIATRVDELLSGVRAQLAIKLFGPDLTVLATQGQAIEQLVQRIPGTRDVALEQIGGEAQLVVRPQRAALSRLGLSVADVMGLVRDGLGGQQAGQIIQGNERYDISVRLAADARSDLEQIGNLRLRAASGALVRLSDVATLAIESGPPQVRRDDVQRRVVVQANVEGRDMGSVVADIRAGIERELSLPAGYTVDIGGQFENQQRAQQRLLLIVPVSLLLIALLLYIAFQSLPQALLILINVPLATVGGVLALWLSGQYLSVPSAVGFITLFGVAVLNGVVMVESINQRRSDGLTLDQALFDGARSRLRPVLMTALTSALGLIPMLLASGIGSEIQRPLATVILGGLVSATLLTLVVLPVLYPLFSKR
ncbi:efflux RND transporter permease subunit [Isoalcanivorax beigongshangi]|uniref:Efflux RND transporter permease subunit n=1 Tax=Isoalcanivorax beigongshangi TaxID=3238810 RepID=A0ABV4AIP6_9GAMM